MRRFLVFMSLFFTVLLQATTVVTENEPDSLVEGVSVITGDYYHQAEDIVVQGVVPITLKRSYISDKGKGVWDFYDYHKASLFPEYVIITEPNGTKLRYHRHTKKNKYFFTLDPATEGVTNTARRSMSSRSNLKNQRVHMPANQKVITVFTPDGGKRIYHRSRSKAKGTIQWLKRFWREGGSLSEAYYGEYFFYLLREELPSGHKILYKRPQRKNKGDPWEICSCDASEKVIYAWARIYPHNGKNSECQADYGVETSDGRRLEYRFFRYKEQFQLKEIESNEAPLQTLHYLTHEKNKVLNAITLPHGRSISFTYYTDPSKPDYLCVKEILKPQSHTTDKIATHTFIYDFTARKTRVMNAYGIPTDYYWDEDKHLTRVDRFTTNGKFHSRLRLYWGKSGTREAGNLLYKVLFDESEKPVQAVCCFYDEYGNVEEERVYGDLTGRGRAFALDGNGRPIHESTDHYSKHFKYSDDGKVLLKKEEDRGCKVEFFYLPNFPLITEERHYDRGVLKKRHTYVYNERRILIEEKQEDVQTGSYTLVKKHLRSPFADRYAQMPEVVEERYGNACEYKLLKKTRYQYGDGARIEEKAIFDANDQFAYALKFRYEKGCLVEETNALGQTAYHRYDELNNQICRQDFGSRVTTHLGYDFLNRMVWIHEIGHDGLNRDYNERYNALNQKIEVEDEYKDKTRYVYDPFGNVIEMYPPTGGVVKNEYDVFGASIIHQDPKGFITRSKNNLYGKPVSISYPDGSKESFIYYPDGSLESHIDQNGVKTVYTYDSFQRVLSKKTGSRTEFYEYDANSLIKTTSAEGKVTSYGYDMAGRKISETFVDEKITFEYDHLGRLYKEKKGDLVLVKKYDLVNHVVKERKEDSKGHILEVTSFVYSGNNKVQTIKEIDGKSAIERYHYDSFNRKTEVIDPLGHKTCITYMKKDRKKITKDPMGLEVIEIGNPFNKVSFLEKRSPSGQSLLKEIYLYDLNGNLISQETITPQGSTKTRWQYKEMNRLRRLFEAAGTQEEKVTVYSYSRKGELIKITKPSGVLLHFAYDDQGNIIKETSSEGSIHYSYVYDRDGFLLQAKDEINDTSIYRQYDRKGRLIQEVLPRNLCFRTDYDEIGRKKALTLPDGSYVIYDYDALYLRQVARYNLSGALCYTHSYVEYDRSGNLLLEETPVGQVKRSYDLNGRPILISSPHFSQGSCYFDPAGNLLETTRQGEKLTYTYDSLYQIIGEKEHSYLYDNRYNRIKKDTEAYTVNALNQTSAFSYDKDGNPLFLEGSKLVYDALDRLIEVKGPTKTIYYTYDAFHRRLSKKIHDANGFLQSEVYYLYDGDNEIGSVMASGTPIEIRILGLAPRAEIGASIGIEIHGQVHIPTHDLHGNVATIYDLNPHRRTLEQYFYTAYGESCINSKNPWRFSSKRTDPETGLIYYGRRYYTPKLGRFLTPDPLGLKAGPNVYAFVSNSPLTHFDLYGLFEVTTPEYWERQKSTIALPPPEICAQMVRMGFPPELLINPPVIPKSSKYYTTGSVQVPGMRIGVVNGINNSFEEAVSATKKIINYTGVDYETHNIYNGTNGVAFDVAECVMLDCGYKSSAPIDLFVNDVRKYHKDNEKYPDRKMLWIAHSQGGFIVRKGLEKLTMDERKRCLVLAIAPARIIPKKLCADSWNYASTRDCVPFLSLRSGNKSQRQPGNKQPITVGIPELILLDPDPEAPKFDHTLLSPTFEKVIKGKIKLYKEGFSD